jgi:hypothetical protein
MKAKDFDKKFDEGKKDICHPAVLVFPGWDIHQENAA